MPEEPSAAQLQEEARQFRDQFKTVLLATSGADGSADASYSPCIPDASGDICIFVSELARHTQNLLAQPQAGLMFIADEKDSRNLFARKRLMLNASAKMVQRNEAEWHDIMERMQQTHGNTIKLLMSLPDFHLFRLVIEGGTYVRGFGQAFPVKNGVLEISPQRRSR
jgi:putative heme iron utilization protein